MPQNPLPQSAKAAVLFLLKYLSPNERTIPGHAKYGNSRIESAVTALNGAMDEIYAVGPSWTFRREAGLLVNAPVTTDGVFTTDSTTFTPKAGDWADWMIGCTIAITGDAVDNQILSYDPVAGTAVLRDPHTGSGGTIATQVWHDSVRLADGTGEVLFPAFWGSHYHLREVANLGEAVLKSTDYQFYEDYGYARRVRNGAFPRDLLRQSLSPGTPAFYWVENFWSNHHEQQKRMRLAPLPSTKNRVMFNSKLAVPQYTVNDVIHPSSGPAVLEAISPTVGRLYAKNDTTATNCRIFPLADFGGNTRQAENFTIVPGGDGTVEDLDISTLLTAPATGDTFLVWYEFAASGTIAEGTILKFPYELIDSVLKKVAAQHFRQSPYFRNSAVIPEIERGYSEALQVVSSSNPKNKNSLVRMPRYT